VGDAKIDIKIGELTFSGEGDQDWLSRQLDKVLEQAAGILVFEPKESSPPQEPHEADFSHSANISSQSLVSFLRSRNALTVQVEKFLATAAWVEAAERKGRLKTSEINSALTKANQVKISNLAEKLNKNIESGYCEKDGSEFYVTNKGKIHLGL